MSNGTGSSSKTNKVRKSVKKQKRHEENYNDKYRELLNDIINGTDEEVGLLPEEPLKASQIGITVWTAEEKTRFFSALNQVTRHDLKKIAAVVGTKCELEVKVYLDLLEQGLKERHTLERQIGLWTYGELPAAIEISAACEKALEDAADALSTRQQEHEEGVQEKQHGRFWLLDQPMADLLDFEDDQGDEGRMAKAATDVGKELQAASEVLKLGNMLHLSSRVFMNSSQEENTWRTYAEDGEDPSMSCTAFLDLYNTVVVLLRRLIPSIIFLANSRIRATDAMGYKHAKVVRRKDVRAALKVLGLEANAQEFWIKAARRCNLQVYDQLFLIREPHYQYDLDDVERVLRSGDLMSISPTSSAENNGEVYPEMEVEDDELGDKPYESSSESEFDYLDDIADMGELEQASRKSEIEHDRHAILVDEERSRKEEESLWEMLNMDPPLSKGSTGDGTLLKPQLFRKSCEESLDWTDNLQYKSQWERYGKPVPAEKFLGSDRSSLVPDG
jgi:RNA polymerase I-specific transcription initiation factor RRN5